MRTGGYLSVSPAPTLVGDLISHRAFPVSPTSTQPHWLRLGRAHLSLLKLWSTTWGSTSGDVSLRRKGRLYLGSIPSQTLMHVPRLEQTSVFQSFWGSASLRIKTTSSTEFSLLCWLLHTH